MISPLRLSFGTAFAGVALNNQLAYLPIVLKYGNQSQLVMGLLDTGSTVNVLPFGVGQQLGLIWAEQTTSLELTGALARVPARGIIVSGQVGSFAPVDLVFAWTLTDEAPLLLGQINFFMEFDVCFFRSEGVFEVSPRDGLRNKSTD